MLFIIFLGIIITIAILIYGLILMAVNYKKHTKYSTILMYSRIIVHLITVVTIIAIFVDHKAT